MRRTFEDVLKTRNIDVKREYSKLRKMFYMCDDEDDESLADMISKQMPIYAFGASFDLDEFNETHDIKFEENPKNVDLDYMILFCEYVYNFCEKSDIGVVMCGCEHPIIAYINFIINIFGYDKTYKNGMTLFVPKDNISIAVSTSKYIPTAESYRVIEYNHHSMKGCVEKKKQTLLKFAELLESKREKLKSINSRVENDLFQFFNKCNIRHNNKDYGVNYCEHIANISNKDLEAIYDEIYQMCLFAFMELEQADRTDLLRKLKANLNNVNKN